MEEKIEERLKELLVICEKVLESIVSHVKEVPKDNSKVVHGNAWYILFDKLGSHTVPSEQSPKTTILRKVLKSVEKKSVGKKSVETFWSL